jgi:hypothetical protein
MFSTDAPQVIEHVSHALAFTPADVRWVPTSPRVAAPIHHAALATTKSSSNASSSDAASGTGSGTSGGGGLRKVQLHFADLPPPSPLPVGQRVNAGAPLMSVVPLSNVWVDANFKEVQLSRMRIGQPVKITTDIYGGKVTYHGHLAGLGAGSGSAFALLPAQNASGNWIKIVQRVPVRIEIDPAQLDKHPLRVGLSMQVEVDVSKADGTPLEMVVVPERSNSTGVFVVPSEKADERIRQIIASNLAPSAASAGMQAARHSEASRSGRRGS